MEENRMTKSDYSKHYLDLYEKKIPVTRAERRAELRAEMKKNEKNPRR